MINAESMTPGLVFCNKSLSTVPESQRFFKVINEIRLPLGKPDPSDNDAELQTEPAWNVEHIASRTVKVYTEAMLENCEPVADKVFCEVDFTPLLGSKLSIEMAHGRVSGKLTEIRCYALKVYDGAVGVEFSVPATLILDGDQIPVEEIRKMEVL